MSDFESANQLAEAGASHGSIPEELSFEKVIKNRTSPPCSLSDFMDYLFYVEHSAESLQFFLWYCDYMQRWGGLLPRQKALAPTWNPAKATEPTSRFITYSHKRARSLKMNKIITIMEMKSESETGPAQEEEGRRSTSSSLSSSTQPRTPSSAILSPTESTKGDWQPFTIQPFRDEISRIVRQYIAESAPRQLNLSTHDREACLRAAQHTTHPSALLPAFMVAEASLRGISHPNFIRWAKSNANRSRIIFLRIIGAVLVLLGFSLDIVLILSRRNHYLRVISILLWWPGITTLIAALNSLCIVLHFHNARQLRPWEILDIEEEEQQQQGYDNTEDVKSRSSAEKLNRTTTTITATTNKSSKQTSSYRQHARFTSNVSTATSATSQTTDPLRKPSLQTFGPKNDYAQERWVALHRRKTVLQRIFEATVPVPSRGALQLVQDRTIFFAIVSGGLLAAMLTVASLFAPAGNLFL
ncbi:hypothetical protein B0H63DRAFT_147041 [Podospora didyma]|uniref:RGS domain-containing protein n=1 Tax=Podospora didyma TaxID=330526 RepID=A0AAE0NSS5_9PEZI|nr:hypothetical protein B0H63DRAFT_147041 [Podospora didyma]